MKKELLKIVFMGTPDFAVPVLDAIVKAGHKVVGVVTAPDKPAGRGKKLKSSPVKLYALEHNLEVLQPEKLRDESFLQQLKALEPDLQVVVAFRMLPKVVWEIPKMGTFNLHASLLPQYRGAAPINFVLINGEQKTGLTTFFIDDKIDTGSIILQKELLINKNDNFETLHNKMMVAGADLVVETIKYIQKGDLKLIDQKDLIKEGEELKAAPKILKEDCKINWNQPISRVNNFIRGLSPWPGAFTYFKDDSEKEYYIKVFKAVPKQFNYNKQPGDVDTDNKTYIKVYCLDGVINIEELQMAGKKKMRVEDLLHGFSFSGRVKVVN